LHKKAKKKADKPNKLDNWRKMSNGVEFNLKEGLKEGKGEDPSYSRKYYYQLSWPKSKTMVWNDPKLPWVIVQVVGTSGCIHEVASSILDVDIVCKVVFLVFLLLCLDGEAYGV